LRLEQSGGTGITVAEPRAGGSSTTGGGTSGTSPAGTNSGQPQPSGTPQPPPQIPN
jgi:hypothetical protein